MVEGRQRAECFNGAFGTPVPAPGSDLLTRSVAKLLFVSLALAKGMMPHLQMRREATVFKKAEAETGAERDDYFDAVAADGTQTLHIGIVQHARRFPPTVWPAPPPD